ncbi:MAG: endoribonuclease Nob1 [Candidatus Methanomethylophilaceae archaeon]|nr:endoribonuclease Nob1 [Candidatus Methanomethylophilaceae archaeon]HIJ00553.1 nucleic acid-binding protein [Candidatus Methanomethylophilaceae archaeon]
MTLVLDSSVLFSIQDLPSEDCVTVPGVWDELRRYKDLRVQYWEGFLRTSSPGDEARRKVLETAELSGDAGRLSPTDIDLLALALELGALLMTDDYSMQNVAKLLDVKYTAVGVKGIKKVWRWKYSCIGCGHTENRRLAECPICGSEMRSVRSR